MDRAFHFGQERLRRRHWYAICDRERCSDKCSSTREYDFDRAQSTGEFVLKLSSNPPPIDLPRPKAIHGDDDLKDERLARIAVAAGRQTW